MNDYKADLSNFKEEPPTPWTDAEYREAFQALAYEFHRLKYDNKQKGKEIERLKNENKKLKFKADVYYARWQTNFKEE